MSTVMLLVAALSPPPSPIEMSAIQVPRSWVLGEERSVSSLRESDVVALIGEPGIVCGSSWSITWSNWETGMSAEWESPAVLICPVGRSPKEVRFVWACLPARLRPLVWLAGLKAVPRSSLLRVGWSNQWMSCVWRFDKELDSTERFVFRWRPWPGE